MATMPKLDLLDRCAPDEGTSAFCEDVLSGLSQRQKAIPARWFYDLVGSELFEDITRLPEYYPTRTEVGLLKAHCGDVADVIGEGRVVVEFGSGSSLKTPHLLRQVNPSAYVPIDISGEFLLQSNADLAQLLPDLPIYPVEADFTKAVALPSALRGSAMLGFFPGSTIGNLAPFAATDLLRSMRDTLGHGSWLLIGIDRVKPIDRLIAAYDDAQGVTAQFNLNLLHRINRELGADIPVDDFHHVARWNPSASRIEMHLEAHRDVAFQVEDRLFFMRDGETIHTENSHKYTEQSARALLSAGGWTHRQVWTDAREDFLLILAEAETIPLAP
ncbi:L-histidine N(alpha)-methyltransferase [Sphingobium sp. B11D3D]|uniref:L-histidine N(alpha)-methyltransferase n=1 Tax=Sphingobium sp. B11D3D TaxID=2940576 RepID=UPI0039B5A1AB|nr:dimethylhistidine N-methyltransferase [Sphingobium sp. B11D3D]